MEGDRVLYVFVFDKDGNTRNINDTNTWGEYWQLSNDSFEKK